MHQSLGYRSPEPLFPAFELSSHTDKLQLIGQRDRRSHNSWMHNNPNIKQPNGNTALMNLQDGKERKIEEGDIIEVSTQQGSIELEVSLTDNIVQGVIAVPHGWGHQGADIKRAAKLAGENINKVIPGGYHNMEPASGQAIMLSHFVDVAKICTDSTLTKQTHQILSELKKSIL